VSSLSGTHRLDPRPTKPIASPGLPEPQLVDPAAGIVLRPWSAAAADVAALAAAWADPAVAAGCRVPDDMSPAAAARWIAGDAARREAGRGLDLVVAPVDAGAAVLGEVGLRNVDRARRRAEISWWIAAEHRGRGLATAAVGLFAGWALSPAGGLDQIWARIDPANLASAAVAERVGFRELGGAGGTAVWSRTRTRPPRARDSGGTDCRGGTGGRQVRVGRGG
jgi:RimJ/RimL family protein N-acetyltransferase